MVGREDIVVVLVSSTAVGGVEYGGCVGDSLVGCEIGFRVMKAEGLVEDIEGEDRKALQPIY